MNFFCPTARFGRLLHGRVAVVSNALVLAGALLLVRPLADRLVGLRAQSEAYPAAAARPAPGRRRSPVRSEGDAIGRLEIPRIGLDLVVFEGTSDATLRSGPGHLTGTPWPSPPAAGGNCVIAGHRDSFFRTLARARAGDVVRLRTESGVGTYRLETKRIVRPRELSVLAATDEPRLTLVTCYPFRWWGAAPLRLVWSAAAVGQDAPAQFR